MLRALTGPPQKKKGYTRVSFTNATAYIHPTHIHYRFHGTTQAERNRLAQEYAAAKNGYPKKLPSKPGLVACVDGDFRN